MSLALKVSFNSICCAVRKLLFVLLFCTGYSIQINDIPPFWHWAPFINYARWTFQGLMVRDCDCFFIEFFIYVWFGFVSYCVLKYWYCCGKISVIILPLLRKRSLTGHFLHISVQVLIIFLYCFVFCFCRSTSGRSSTPTTPPMQLMEMGTCCPCMIFRGSTRMTVF